MKLLVFSDSHGKDDVMRRLMLANRDACFFHLGDGAASFLSLCRDLSCGGYAVKGNCDFFTGDYALPRCQSVTLEGFRFFLTHGDAYAVNYSRDRLAFAAKEAGCHVALYGHTHVSENRYLPAESETDSPLYLFNPGSISRPRDGKASYGVIELVNRQIHLRVVPLKEY